MSRLRLAGLRRTRWSRACVLAAALPLGGAAEPGQEALVWPTSIRRLEKALAESDPDARRRAIVDFERLPAAIQRRLLPSLLSDPDPEIRLASARAAVRVRLVDAGERVTGWLNHADARVREAAARVLSTLRHEPAVPSLGRVLGDPEASVRMAAAEALGSSISEKAATYLLGHLDDTDPAVREAVISALEELGDPRAVVPLIGRVKDQRASIRRRAAAALGALGDPRAVDALTVALSDADASVRAAAATALGALEADAAVWSLRALLGREADPDVRGAIIDALGAIGSEASCASIVSSLSQPSVAPARVARALSRAGDAAIGSLRDCLFGGADDGAAEVCVTALGEIGGKTATEIASQALREGVVPAGVALRALGQAGDVRALPSVLEYLTSPRPDERRAAIDAAQLLMQPGTSSGLAVGPIEEALELSRGSRLEQAALIGLLGRTESARAAQALVPLARSTDEYRRAMAIEALGLLGRSGADAVLVDALQSERYATRWTAAVALRRVGSRASIPRLLELLGEASPEQAQLVAMALAGPLSDDPDAGSVARVAAHLAASRGPLRDSLIDALSRVDGPAGGESLSALAHGVGPATRAKVAEALARHPSALGLLRELADDPHPRVRANAVWSLGYLAQVDDLPRLASALADRDVSVGSNAVAALSRTAGRLGVDASRRLCPLLDDDRRSYVLANALAGLAATGGDCPDLTGRLAWLLEHHSTEIVRIAAARLLSERRVEAERGRGPLRRCAERDPSGRVAAVCASAAPPGRPEGSAPVWLSVLVEAEDGRHPTPEAPFSVVFGDGLIRSGRADRRGYLTEAEAPPGPLRLLLPAPFAE